MTNHPDPTTTDGRVKLVRRSLPDRINLIADDLLAVLREMRAENSGTSEQRLKLAAATVGLRMAVGDVRELLAGGKHVEQAEGRTDA